MCFSSTYFISSFFNVCTYLKIAIKRPKRSGWCRQVGSDKERSKVWVGSGSGNARGRLGPRHFRIFHILIFVPYFLKNSSQQSLCLASKRLWPILINHWFSHVQYKGSIVILKKTQTKKKSPYPKYFSGYCMI